MGCIGDAKVKVEEGCGVVLWGWFLGGRRGRAWARYGVAKQRGPMAPPPRIPTERKRKRALPMQKRRNKGCERARLAAAWDPNERERECILLPRMYWLL